MEVITRNDIISSKYNTFINNIIKKYINDNNLKIKGKILHYIQNILILKFYCTIYKTTNINPFSSDISLNIEFIEDSTPYAQILNDFINPTLNDGRNIFYCLSNKHQYIFKKKNLEECEKIFYEVIDNIKSFLLCLKENIQINAYIYYGEYELGHLYQINDFIINKNTIKFYRIIQIDNSKNEEMKYIVITQLYFLFFKPEHNDMSLATLEQWFYLKDIHFSLDEIILNKKKIKKTCFLKILNNTNNNIFEIEFYLYSDNNIGNYDDHNKYVGLKNTLLGKKNEIDLKKYKIVITNYKPLYTIEMKKNNKKKNRLAENMYNDYKLYISYFEELYNYYKDFKEENIKKRVKIYLSNLTYFCVDFITFYDSNPEEVKLYQTKMATYLNDNEI